MDAGFGISYNSLVWIKDTTNSEIIFDPDLSNVSPGFQMGLPEIEKIYNTGGSNYSFLMVNPDGSRTEFRRVGTTNTFEPGDSSYRQLVISSGGVTSKAANIELTVTSTDGTMMHYLWKSHVSKYECEEIKDRNGNIISIGYTSGRLTSMEDTLGRVVTINRDGGGYPTTIEQTWKDTNGSGSNTTHTWATFSYTNATVSTSFSGLTVIGPANSTTVKVLEKITYPDGSFTKFEYNGYIQVKKISQVAADSTSHILNYVTTDLASVSGSQTDCPRFGETKTWVENFNLSGGTPQEVVVTNSLTTGATYSLPNSITGSATRIDVAMTGHPDGLYSRTYVGASGYKEGLTLATEDCTGSNCATRLRWTWTDWTQDNTGVSYITNPRVTESRVGDGSNTKKTTIGYGSNGYGLPEEVKVYDTDLSTVLKTQTTTYELGSTYTSRRIIGLPSETKLWQGTTSGTLMSKVTYAYDYDDDFAVSGMGQNNTGAVQHDDTNYSATFSAGRGNLTSVKRWDATDPTDSADAVTSTILYNITGAVVAKTDPLSRTVKIDYTDNFNSSPGVTTYAYPKRVYDPAGNYSEIKYRYDIGANVEATSPAPAGQTYGKKSQREYETATGRLLKDSVLVNTTVQSYTRYEYPNTGIHSKIFSTIIDKPGSTAGPDSADEVLSESWTDGAGRVRLQRSPHTWDGSGDTATWSGVQTEYDVLGRVYRTSVPTETNSSWAAAGDDYTRGWIWNKSYYDWKGRTIRTVPSDSTGSDGKDTLISYAGCGCAGGQVTTVSGPETDAIDVTGTPQTDARRTQKIYEDILGRTYKTEVWDLDGAGTYPYSTTKVTFNGRDQATLIRQYEGGDSSSTYQDTTMSYDGHGRLYQSHKPEQRNSSNTLKYTTYTYNLDDTVATQTDGRGVVTSYTYNSRQLVTNIAWNVGATGVSDPTDVTFTYDNLGNRTQMTDGLGQVDYSYNSLSQMTDETRDFTDTLVDAPISGGKFKLEYTYTLSGGLKSYKDPYGQEIDYTHDKTGRLNTVTGSTFASVTSYASNPEYRAWGALKHLDYANGNDVDMSYDNQLRPLRYELNRSSTVLMEKEYEYYPSGEVRHVEGGVNNLVTFDFAGRPNKSKSGIEADGTSTATNLSLLPFRHAFTYNAFNNLVDFNWTRYTDEGSETHTITNNRRGSYQEDDDGRDLTKGHYDAAGNNYLQEPENFQYYRYFDGERAESKRGVVIYNTLTELWEPVIYGYFIRSTVLGGQIVSEAGATGKKTHTYVYANGTVLAHQVIKIVSGSPQESVAWEHRDPHNKRVQYASTAGGQPSGIGLESGDVDSLGRMVGTLTYTPPSHDAENTISPFYQAPEAVGTGQCKSVEDAIRNSCSPMSVAQQITKALGRWESVKVTVDGNEDITWTWVDPEDEKGSICDNRLARIFGDDDVVVGTETEPGGVHGDPNGPIRVRGGDEDPKKGVIHIFTNKNGSPSGTNGNLFTPIGFSSIRGKMDPNYLENPDTGKSMLSTYYSNIQVTYRNGSLKAYGFADGLVISFIHSGPINNKNRVPTPIKNGKTNAMGSVLIGTIGADGSPYDGGGAGGRSTIDFDLDTGKMTEIPNTPKNYIHSHTRFYRVKKGKKSAVDPRSVFCRDLGF